MDSRVPEGTLRVTPSGGYRQPSCEVGVTGMGCVTASGTDVSSLLSDIFLLKSRALPLPSETGINASTVAIPGLNVPNVVPVKAQRRLARSTLLGLIAGVSAIDHAGLGPEALARTAICVGNGMGGIDLWEGSHAAFLAQGPDRISPLVIPAIMPNACASWLARLLNWSGPATTISNACAAGASAVVLGARMIRWGLIDVALVGGTESLMTPGILAAFARTGAMSKRSVAPHGCRPFDVGRDGFVMAEGAAFLVLENAEHAQRRGARIHSLLLGFGENNDAFDLTQPAPGGAGAARCMTAALEDAGLGAEEIVHLNAHGTGTRLNDQAEAEAIATTFGPGAPTVTSSKAVTGHLLAASGALELIIAIECMRKQTVPAIGNLETPDPALPDIDLVRVPRSIGLGPFLTNSFAFGGHNVSIVGGPSD
ncbi:MAG: beta-ketoacyl-[acyl-carrier-protein] synthase family protein [Sulfobacillus sp.]